MTSTIRKGSWYADDQLGNWFTHHPPRDDQDVRRYQAVRDGGRELAERILDECPISPERDQALARIREAVMWANAAIACHQDRSGEPRDPAPPLS